MNFEIQEGYDKRVEFSPAVELHIMTSWTKVLVLGQWQNRWYQKK